MLNFNGFDTVVLALNEYMSEKHPKVEVCTTAEGEHFPKIVVEDIETQSVNRTLGGMESYSLISVQVSIYAPQMTVGNTVYSGRNITRQLASEVEYVLGDLCGMNRTSSRPVQNADRNIDRYVMVYTALQNDKKNLFY